MRKQFMLLTLAALALGNAACSYDDSDLWNAVDNVTDRVDALEKATAEINADISALQALVSALQNNVTITSVTPSAEGYVISFSDGTTATISNGRDGQNGNDGLNAPEISVRKDSDGLYYWTVGGEWLTVDGEKVRATALDGQNGQDGKDAVAPQVRINPASGEWEISIDGGNVWTSTGIPAQGVSGDSMFKRVDASNPAYILFVLSDDTELRVPRYDATAPLFAIKDAEGTQIIRCGQSKTYEVECANIAEYTIQRPDGWRVAFDGTHLTVSAPAESNTYAEQEGTVAIVVVSENGKSMIVKMAVATFEMRVLTFEDADAHFSPFSLDYCGKTIAVWSDLIDDKQYGGQLLYGDSGMGMDEPYWWYDEGNTELMHLMPTNYGSYCYWGGGHAISNYASTNLDEGDFTHQLSVYGNGGHNGSANFAMHFGYIDDSSFNMIEELPALMFYDGTEHVIDHMWVMNSLYAMNCFMEGNGLTPQVGPGDWVKVTATGYDADGQKTGDTYIYMCNGPDNIMRDWTKWDLSVLGKIAKIEFNVTGSVDNGYGTSTPAYFAYDDVAVIF